MPDSALARLERIAAEAFEDAGPTGAVTITQELVNEVAEESQRLADEALEARSMASRCPEDRGGYHGWVPHYEDVGGLVTRCIQCGKTSRPRRWQYPIR